MAKLTDEEIERRDYEDAVRWQAERDAAEARGEIVSGGSFATVRRLAKWPMVIVTLIFATGALIRML